MVDKNNDSAKPHEAQKPVPETHLTDKLANAAASFRDEAQQLLKDNYVKVAVTAGVGLLALTTRGKLLTRVAESVLPETVGKAATEAQAALGDLNKPMLVEQRSLAAHPLPSSLSRISGKLHDRDWESLLGTKHNNLPSLHIDGNDTPRQHVTAYAPEAAASAPGPRPLILTHNGQELELRLPKDGGLPIIQPKADSTRLAHIDAPALPRHAPSDSNVSRGGYHPPILTHKGKELELLLPQEGLPIIRTKD